MHKTITMKNIILFGLLASLALTGFSQDGNKAVGIRGGLSSGFEYRIFTDDVNSYRVLLSGRKHGIQLTGLKEFHQLDVFDIGQELSFVYGFGAHAGFESWDNYYMEPFYPYGRVNDRKTSPIVGLDGLAGLEYIIPTLPLTAGLEVKPYFNLFGEDFFNLQPFDFAFTLRYMF